MALARLQCIFLLLLYSKESYGQQVGPNNRNLSANSSIGLQQQQQQQQQGFQRMSNNINQIQNVPNGGLNGNQAQPNLQTPNFQQISSLSGVKQGNLQQTLNLPPNLQSQGINNMQITKLGFTPVPPNIGNTFTSSMQFQNTDVPNGQIQSQFHNMPSSNLPVSQTASGPISSLTLGDLVGLKGQPLLSLINAQHTDQSQQNQQNGIPNMIPGHNQLTDMQKQLLMRSFQAHDSALNQQGINIMQTQPRVVTMDNQQAITVHAVPHPQPAQAIVTPLGQQPAYITVQAKPLDEYLKQQTQVTATEDPIMSLMLSEYGPHYTISAAPPKKGSKLSLKALIPLIISLLKEKKFCGCGNCKCENNTCQTNSNSNTSIEAEIAQIFGGYSSQKTYGANAKDSSVTSSKKTLDHELNNNDKHKAIKKKIMVPLDTEEISDEDDSEYDDDD